MTIQPDLLRKRDYFTFWQIGGELIQFFLYKNVSILLFDELVVNLFDFICIKI